MKMNRLLEWGIIIGLYLTLLIPFVVSKQMFFPFITGKALFFRILVEIVLALWLILVIRDKSYLPRKSFILWSFVSFVVVLFFANLFGINQTASFWSNFERMDGFVTIVHLLAYFVVLISIFKSKEVWRNFLRVSIIASLIMAIYGFFQLGGKVTIHQGGVRLDGTLGNATYLAVYMLFNLFFAWFLFIKEKVNYWKSIYTISVIFNLIILYYTATRGAILGLIGGVLLSLLLIFVLGKEDFKLKKYVMWLFIGIFVFIGLFISVKDTEFIRGSQVLGRFATISLEDRTTLSRFVIWGIGIDAIKERPLLGYGQSNFNVIFDKGYDPILYNQEQWFDRAHNVVVDLLIAGGILALLTYLSILFSTIYLLWKKANLSVVEKSVLTGLLSAYFFQNLFVFDNLMSYILFAVVLALINFESIGINIRLEDIKEGVVKYALYVLVGIVLVVTIYSVNVPTYKSASNLLKALQLVYQSETNQILTAYPTILENLEFYKKALAENAYGNPEIRTQLIQTSISIVKAVNVSEDTKQLFHDTAITELIKQIEEFPLDARFPFVLGTYYAQLGQFESSIIYLEKAHELSPRKQIISGTLSSLYARGGEVDKALSLAKETYEMETRSDEAWKAYVDVLIIDGQTETADQLVQDAISLERYNLVIELLTRAVVKDQQNIRRYTDLSSIYLRAGRQVEAIKVLEQAKIILPQYKGEVDNLIKDIRS